MLRVVSFCVACRTNALACLSTKTVCECCFSDLGHAWTRGGGVHGVSEELQTMNCRPVWPRHPLKMLDLIFRLLRRALIWKAAMSIGLGLD